MTTYYVTGTAEEYRYSAAECRKRSVKSFETCDTDGFLSQWAADSMALTYEKLAELAEAGGVAEFCTLARDGEMVPCKRLPTKYGTAWAVFASWEALEWRGEIVEWVGLSSKAVAKKGYEEIWVTAPACVRTVSGGSYSVHSYVDPVEPLTPTTCVRSVASE